MYITMSFPDDDISQHSDSRFLIVNIRGDVLRF